jgi:uncharacterized Zn finger protein
MRTYRCPHCFTEMTYVCEDNCNTPNYHCRKCGILARCQDPACSENPWIQYAVPHVIQKFRSDNDMTEIPNGETLYEYSETK